MIIRVGENQKTLPINLSLEEITKYHIIDWREKRLKTLKASSVKRDMSLMSAFFNICVKEWGYIKENPMADVSKPSNILHRVGWVLVAVDARVRL